MASGDDQAKQFIEPMMERQKISDDEEEDEDDETWEEMEAECEHFMSCLFCSQNFKTMAVALDHCRSDHNFNLSVLKNKYRMDCYSYICMINYLRKEGVTPEVLLSFKDPPWLNKDYLVPVVPDDPWLMFDFEGLESPMESRSESPEQNYHVVNSENGLVTLTEQHFVQLQHKIKHLTLQVQEKEEALSVAADQIQKMKAVTQALVGNDSDEPNVEKTMVKMKISEDDGYFSGYSHFGIHHEMLSDRVRTMGYKDAILNNPSLVKDKIVLDVGCGTGILSMFAATAGATKVYGVDQSEIIYHAMEIIRENNLEDKIDLVHGKVEEVSLSTDKVDVIVSEWMGYFLLYEGMLDSLIAARDRFLKADGRLLPNRCVLYVQGISDVGTYDNLVEFWSNVYGFKMSCLLKEVVQEAQIFHVLPGTTSTFPAPVLDLNLYTAHVDSTNFTSDFFLESTVDGNLTALCGYFDAFFEVEKPVVISTSPETEKTHWKQTVFFLPKTVPISKGMVLKGSISCRRLAEDNRKLMPAFGGGSESLNRNPEGGSGQETDGTSSGHAPEISPPPPPLRSSPAAVPVEDLPPPKLDFSAPPPYEVAAKLPTYEEVQREKTRLGEPQINNNSSTRPNPQSLAFLAIDTEGHDTENESGLLGTDFMFFTAFLVAFLFNWIGFLLLMCFCHTIAARYGALSGFGLSLAKWTFIVKHSTDLASRENSWLWWLIMAFGLLIFVRAIIQYLNIKRDWRFLSGTAQERLLFFY